MTLNIVTDPGRIDLPVSARTAASCLITTPRHPPLSIIINSIVRKNSSIFICLSLCLFVSSSGISTSKLAALFVSVEARVQLVIYRCVCVNDAILPEGRQKSPVTIVMRGIYISYLR